jgi:hypothetical protein
MVVEPAMGFNPNMRAESIAKMIDSEILHLDLNYYDFTRTSTISAS